MSPTIDAACAAHGLVYNWTDGDENDWKSPRLSPAEINARFAHYLHPGYISLRHSGGTHAPAIHPTSRRDHDPVSNPSVA